MPRKTPENEDDFIRMQQEAIRRVRNMQDRARSTIEGAGIPLDRREPGQPAAANAASPARPVAAAPREVHNSRPFTQSVWNAPAPASRPVTPQAAHPVVPVGVAESVPFPPSPPRVPPPIPARQVPEQANSLFPIPKLLSDLFPSINLSFDKEQIMLIVLMYMMYQDGTDRLLILALAYVLLV